MTARFTTALRNAWGDAVDDATNAGAGAGKLRIYTGAQPASTADAATGTLLAEVTLGDPAFGACANGILPMNNPASVNASATGTAGWYRVLDSNNVAVHDGSVTATGGGGDLELSTTALVSGSAVDLGAGNITMPGG